MSYSLEQLETESAQKFTPKTAIEHVFSLLNAEHREIAIIMFYAVCIGLLSLVVPIGVQTLVDLLSFGSVYQPLAFLTFLVLGLMAISGILTILQFWIVERLQRRIFVRVALDLARRIPQFRMLVFKTEWPSDLINRFFEVALVQKSISKLLLDGTALILQTSLGLLILTFYHPYLLTFVLTVIFSLLFIMFVLGRGAISTGIKESSAKHTVLIWLENLAEHPMIFRSSIGKSFAFSRADSVTASYLTAREKHFRILLLQKVGFVVLQTIASAALLGLGGYLVLHRELTLGQLVASEIIVSGVLSSFTKLARLIESFYDLVASISKLDSLIELDIEENQGDWFDPGEAPIEVQIDKVSNRFSENQPVLEQLSLSITPGQKVAIYGKNGTGKSLLADLLLKFHNPDSGRILLSKQDLRDLNPQSIREHVKLLGKVEAFRGTIDNNLRLDQEYISRKDVRIVLEKLGLKSDLEKLKNGLDTWLREDGRPLSSGQVSRLVLARALLMNPGLLIVDSLLDDLDEDIFQSCVLPTLMSLKSTVCIMTHSTRLAEAFPVSYCLRDGKIFNMEEYS